MAESTIIAGRCRAAVRHDGGPGAPQTSFAVQTPDRQITVKTPAWSTR